MTHIAEIQHAVAERLRVREPDEIDRPLTLAEAAWERYRQATIRHLAAGEERDAAYIEFENLFLTNR
ncbi:MAG TPA: hypothetical protein VN579_04265 [Bryobacteraceae bacterium]|nr:hypothetical protein [Bryobacteraceae bacterium]